jgi:hypothetical protein
MAKTKRMLMGGVANAAMQSVKSAPKFNAPPGTPKGTVSAGAPPPSGGPMGGIRNVVRQAAQAIPKSSVPPPGSPRVAPPPPQLQFMSDKLRGGAAGAPTMGAGMQGIGQAMRGQQANMPPPQGGMGGMAGMQAKFGPPSVAPGAPKTMGGMGMKSGGTASSRADGCATKGKTKGRFV